MSLRERMLPSTVSVSTICGPPSPQTCDRRIRRETGVAEGLDRRHAICARHRSAAVRCRRTRLRFGKRTNRCESVGPTEVGLEVWCEPDVLGF